MNFAFFKRPKCIFFHEKIDLRIKISSLLSNNKLKINILRHDYVRHPVERVQLKVREQFIYPKLPMEKVSSYNKEFICKLFSLNFLYFLILTRLIFNFIKLKIRKDLIK